MAQARSLEAQKMTTSTLMGSTPGGIGICGEDVVGLEIMIVDERCNKEGSVTLSHSNRRDNLQSDTLIRKCVGRMPQAAMSVFESRIVIYCVVLSVYSTVLPHPAD
jgi:hypothetical protein